MINFNFTVRPIDAENIISILNDYVANQEAKCIDYIAQPSKANDMNLSWTKGHVEYVKGLIKTMAESSTVVENK